MKSLRKRIVSFVILVVLMINMLPTQTVQAADANFMSGQMINFFKTSNQISDVSALTPEEIRTYAVFISNFYKPGIFTLSSLNSDDKDSALVKSIGQKFFGSDPGADNLNTIIKLNKVIYNTLLDDMGNDGKCNLYPSKKAKEMLTGKDLLNKMTYDRSKSKLSNGINKSATIYYGKEDRQVCMDLSVPAVRGAFKILAAYSPDYMFGSKGILGMSQLYIDGFGNIWGAFDESFAIGETTVETTTEMKDLKLVMPACLNPLAFTSFAAAEKTTTTADDPTQADLKLPLNNAFAMGAFVNMTNFETTFAENTVPYYNFRDYFKSKKDYQNILNIYGITSPFKSLLNSDAALNDDLHYVKTLKDYMQSNFTKIHKGSTYIVLSNDMAKVQSGLSALVDANIHDDKAITNSTDEVLNYLYGNLKISTSQVADKLYYFGSNSNDTWADTTFSDLGMLGANLFTDTKTSYYTNNSNSNGLTQKLSDFYTDSSVNIDDLIESRSGLKGDLIDNKAYLNKNSELSKLKSAANALASVFKNETKDRVNVVAAKGYGELIYILSKYYDGTKLKDISSKEIKKIANTDNTVITDVSQSVSALCFLLGYSTGELYTYDNTFNNLLANGAVAGLTATNDNTTFIRYPLLFSSDNTKNKEINSGMLTAVADASKFTINKSMTAIPFLGNLVWSKKQYIYALGDNDNAAYDNLKNNKYLVNSNTNIDFANNQLFFTFHTYNLFSAYGTDNLSTNIKSDGSGNYKIKTKISGKDIEYTITNFIADGSNNWPGIFFGYLVDILQMDKATKAATAKANKNKKAGETAKTSFDCYSFSSPWLPTPNIPVSGGKLDLSQLTTDSGLSNSDEKTLEEIQKDLVRKIYGIVSDEPNEYRNKWLKSTVDGFLLTVHRNITGSWLTNMYTVSAGSGSTYQGVVGYIYTPSLNDLPFTAWIMQNYMQVYAFCLLLISMCMVIMVLLRLRTWRQGVGIFAFMCIALLLPSILINNTIDITNKFTDSLYSNKFNFWAMTEQQQDLKALEGVVDGSKEDAMANTMQKAEDLYSTDAGVRIKWMSPKKTDVFNSLYTSTDMSESFATNLTIFKWLFSSFIYESEFVGSDPLATYVYRPYNSITKAGQDYYTMALNEILVSDSSGIATIDSISKKTTKTLSLKDNKNKGHNTKVKAYSTIFDIYNKAKTSERSNNYAKMFYAALVPNSLFEKDGNFANIFYSENKVNDINSVGATSSTNETNSIALWGMDSEDVLNVMFNKAEKSGLSGDIPGISGLPTTATADNSENANKYAFLLNTESPYYYFYNVLKYRYGKNSTNGFKEALLNRDIYKVRDAQLLSTAKSANGSIRDFLDLQGLFTYMIPYLSVCNDYVYDWTSINGTSVSAYNFNGSTADNSNTKIADNLDSSFAYQQNLKKNMQSVWNMYTPWVDQLNSLDIHNKRVTVGTKKVNIENTLNPSYYLIAGRPMMFSEADMIAKGYNYSNLTDTEMRIQKVLSDTYEDLMYLVNYYDMDEEVLLSAAAMYATFNFDKEFSQTDLLGDSTMLYPQNFEMKNFNHDAFMRLALLNSTGETVFDDTDLYERVMAKTSIFTGILLIAEDVLAVIAIPTLKFIVLIMLLFLGLIFCVTCVVSPPEKILKDLSKVVFLPTALFMVATIIFAWLVSMLIGDGLTAYVGSQNMSIATNDPTITILILVILDVIYTLVLFRLAKMLFESLKSYGFATIFSALGIIGDGAIGLARYAKQHTVDKAGNALGSATNKGIKGIVDGIAGGIMYGKDGAEQGFLNGLNGHGVRDTLSKVGRQKHNDKIALARGIGKSGSRPFGTDVTSSINSKASTLSDTPLTSKVKPTVSNDVKPKIKSTVMGKVLSVPLKIGTGTAGGVKIVGQAIQAGAHATNVGARVAGHFTKEGAKVVGNGTVAGVKIAGKAVGKAYDYVSERGVGGMVVDGAKLTGKGAIAVGKFAAKPVVYGAKATARYAGRSVKDAVTINKGFSDKINTTHNALYKHNHGYDLDLKAKALGKKGTPEEQAKALKNKTKIDNKNSDRANREAWDIINKLESHRKK